MMTKRVSVLVGGALALMLAGAASAAGTPAVNDGYDWTMRVNEDRASDAILAYEVDNTDDQPLNFTCEEGAAASLRGFRAARQTLPRSSLNRATSACG